MMCLLNRLCVLWLLSIQIAVAAVPVATAKTEKTLQDCLQLLASDKGGWCEMRVSEQQPSISAVWPTALPPKTEMVVGPRAILEAWNSAAIDEKNRKMYFFGGGHADYGGNEVYEFDIEQGLWQRLTEPSPLDFLISTGEQQHYCWVPDLRTVPPSTHTYDGFEFNPTTGTLFLVSMEAANGSCFVDKTITPQDKRLLGDQKFSIAQYEFNPSPQQQRNGLAPLTWRRVGDQAWSYPRMAVLPNGRIFAGNSAALYEVDVAKEKFKVLGKFADSADWGDGTAVVDNQRQWLWTIHRNVLIALALRTGAVMLQHEQAAPHGKSLQIDQQGRLVAWNGSNIIALFDPQQPRWQILDWGTAGPQVGDARVYGKWRYLADLNVFVGISTYKSGVWVYKQPQQPASKVLAEQSAQSFIDNAKAGANVRIPSGIYYGGGLVIDKSLTVDLQDAEIRGVANRKAIINITCKHCQVLLENFHGDGIKSACLFDNCAGIKAEGEDFELTVRHAHIDNTVMGILTDNRGGRLRIEDTLIENTGRDDSSYTLAHGVYAGLIDELVMSNSTIRRVFGSGHLLKSRASTTRIEHSRLEGLDGYPSRIVDFSCGGNLVIQNSVLNQGRYTDNAEMISVGTEPDSCDHQIRPSSVTMTDNLVIIDRTRAVDEPARDAGASGLFKWRAPFVAVNVLGNRIVNPAGSDFVWNYGETAVPDQTKNNVFCLTRDECK